MVIEILLYETKYKEIWDEFIIGAKNSHFMFCRDYMEYHSDRFTDYSLMFMVDNKLLAVLPANIDESIVCSHQGLSFGGIISNSKMTVPLMLNIFSKLIEYLRIEGIKTLIYKAIPYIYSTLPAQEDLFALNINNARLFRVDTSSTIDLFNKIDFSSRRKRGVKKAIKNGCKVIESNDYGEFYSLLTSMLVQTHNTKATHSLSEIECLVKNFSDRIKLYATYDDDEMCAGVLVFEMNHWAHAQYIVSSEKGKSCGALDLLFFELINTIYDKKRFFDFGISTESQGKILNTGLIAQKEEFGARSIIHNFFELSIGQS